MHPTLLELEATGLVLLFAALVVLIIDANIGERDGQWRSYFGWFSTTARMRRFVSGRWHHRVMTDAEAADDDAS